MDTLCKTCEKPLRGSTEESNQECDECFGKRYEEEAILDNLTDKETYNE